MKKIRDRIRQIEDRRCIDKVKADLKATGKNIKLIEKLEEDIEAENEKLDALQGGFSGADPVQGGGSSSEDRYCKVLDKKDDLIKEKEKLEGQVKDIKVAIKHLDDPKMIAIVYKIWIYKIESVESLGAKYGVSRQAIWKKSDIALLALYKYLYKED